MANCPLEVTNSYEYIHILTSIMWLRWLIALWNPFTLLLFLVIEHSLLRYSLILVTQVETVFPILVWN